MNSWTVFTGSAFEITIRFGTSVNIPTGTVSRMKSNGEMLVERGRDRVVGAGEQHGVAVGRRGDRGLRCDIAAGAGAVLDHELLAEMVGQRLRHDARHGVDRAARRKAVDEAHRMVGIAAGLRGAGKEGSEGQAKQGGAQTSGHGLSRHIVVVGHARMLSQKRGLAYKGGPSEMGMLTRSAATMNATKVKSPYLVCAGALLLGADAMAQDGGKAISKTTISSGTATPGGGFPLYGNAFAEIMNAADPDACDRAAQHQGQQREHSAAGRRQARHRAGRGRAVL